MSLDWDKFINYNRKFLALNEIKHSIFLSTLDNPFNPDTQVWQFEKPGHCAVMEPGRAIVLGNLTETECRKLAEMTAGIDYPGVLGAGLMPHWFGNRASELGIHFKLIEAQQIYALRISPQYPVVHGHSRNIEAADVATFVQWYTEFHDQAMPLDPLKNQKELEELALSGHYMFWEDDGKPVSMAGYTRTMRTCATITGVYTPPELRGQGYAGAVTAAVAESILATGLVAILYTDIQNPASNRCYSRLGFKPEYPSFHLHR